MKLFRNFGLPVVLMLALTISLFAQNQQSNTDGQLVTNDKDGRLVTNNKKSLDGNTLLDNYTPLENFVISDETSQLISLTTYPMIVQNGVALEDMSSGTTQLVAASQDDTASAVTNIGFDFWLDGVRQTQFSANANGLMKLGAVVVNNGANGRTNNFATANDLPKIAPYWDDLCTSATGKVHYKVVGAPGSRKLVVEWQNMVTFGTSCTDGLAIGTYQVWLFESSNPSLPGSIQFVYGAIGANAVLNGGYSNGIGSSATSFASITTTDDSVSYATSANAQVNTIAAGKSYLLTPNIPLAPSGGSVAPVTPNSLQLNWADNAINEVGYAIYRSTDNVTFTFLTQTAANAVLFNDTGLAPSTQYFYRVFAVTEGALSSSLNLNSTTLPPGNDTCAGAGGNWDAPATWTDGSVPTATDNVTIGSGCTVTVNVTNAAALNVTIDSGGTLQAPTTGTVVNNNLTVSGNVTNNGTLDFSTNADTSAAILTFGAGAANVTFGGTGATNDVRAITVAKGAQATVVELNAANFTVRGSTTDVAGYLTVTSGTFKISGTFTMTNRTFPGPTYTVPLAGGFWLNNANYTVAPTASGTATSYTGLFRLTQGVYNVGVTGADGLGGGTGATFIFEGGTFNSPRFDPQNAVTFTMSNGTINVGTVANTRSNFGTFELFSTTSTFTMSGGTINIIQAATGATPIDYQVLSATVSISGGVLNVGTGATATNFNFRLRGAVPAMVIDNTTNNKTATFTAQSLIRGNITINPGTTFAINGFLVAAVSALQSGNVVNNGTITGSLAGSRLYFLNAGGPVTSYSGSGIAGAAGAPLASVDFDGNGTAITLSGASPNLITTRVILFSGNVANSGKLTLGDGGTTTGTIQIGNTTTPTPAGTFDAPFTFNLGTGGQVANYLRTTTSYTTGGEISPSRVFTTMTVDNNVSGLNIGGGNLTVTGALALTNGIVSTGANVLTHNGAATRTTGFVNGNLNRTFAATGAYTYFVGQGGFSPVAASVTAGTGDLTVRAVQGAQPNIPSPSKALSRYWKLTGTGLTADLAFNYLDPTDIPGTATEANFGILKYDGAFTFPGGTVNTTANTATITGVTSFSDWTLAEPAALLNPGVLQLSNTAYSVAENVGSVTVTVNRTVGTDGAVTVDYALGGGTATGGAACGVGIDYVNTGGTVSFANGEASKTFNVATCGDTDVEGDETFNVTLSNPTGGATLGSPTVATVTILNDDVSGPVTVTATAGTTSGTYANLTAAIAAVNNGTHQGAIVININQTVTEPDTVVINGSGAGSASYTSILIRPTADAVSDSGPTLTGRGLIELNGADNVTIDGDNPNTAGTNRNLTLQNTAANTVTFTSVIRVAVAATIVTSADNNIFRNLNILGSATGRNIGAATSTTGSENTTFGIFAGPGASTVSATTPPAAVASVSTSVGAGATATNLLVGNNNIVTAARGVSINGSATTVFPGLQITGNTIGNQTAGAADQVYAIGITGQGSANGLISGNTMWVEGFVASSAAGQGINVGVNSATGTFTIENNKVNRVRCNNVGTFSAFGINLGGGNNHIVQNNFVSGVINDQTAGTGAFSTTFGAFGIRVGSGTGHKVYHNSVHLYGPLPGVVSTDLTAALGVVATTQTGVDIRNNIFSNQITGGNPTGTRNVAVFLPSAGTSAMNLTLNNNAYFAGTDALNRLAQVGTTFGTGEFLAANFDPTSTTPATNFRSYTSTLSAAGTNDNASFATTSAPPFTSNVNLHIPAGTATRLESGGAAVGVATDIDLETRNATTPDIGADEFAGLPPPANDIAATVLVNPTNGATLPVGLSFSPQATFSNNGTVTQTNVTVRYRIIDASTSVIYNQTVVVPSIAPLQNAVVTFPSTSLPAAGTYTIRATAELAGDQDTSNDNISGTVTAVAPIGGTINVGTGETYTSLTNAGGVFQALNTAGISSNTVINVTSDLTAETGAVPLNQLTEVGAGGYTVTIKPSGAARTISGTSAASSGLIILNGADRTIFDGSLSGGTDRSLTITNNQATTGIVIWMRSPNASNGATNNTVKNCIINGAPGPNSTTVAGVLTGSSVTLGGDAEAPNSNNTIQNNWIYRVQNSLYLRGGLVAANFDQNWTVTGNELGSTVVNDKNIFRGMLIGNSANFSITGNTVHGVQSTTVTTAAMSGIQLALLVNTGTIANNVISDIKNVSTTGTGAFGMQISSSSTASNITIANNFITDVTSLGLATVTSNGYGMMFNGSGTGYNVYFNSINMNTNQGTGTTSAALFVNSTFATAGALNVRNNIFANTQTTGTRNAVHVLAAASVFSAIDFNDYFAQNVGIIGGVTRPTLTDWQTGTGQDANSKAVDPLFVSATNLHLQTGSPMVNMAAAGTGITTDIDGQTRDATPDIGADELPFVAQPGTLQFSSATYAVGEAGGNATLTVTRTGGSDGAVTVDYALGGGTATGGAACGGAVDYVNTGGTVSFANGETSKTFNVAICNDVAVEGNETFNSTLSNATGGATIGTPNPATVTITDDDTASGTVSVNDVRITEGNAGSVNATFTLTYTGSSPATASVQYATANGTAVAGVDYIAKSGTVSFGGSVAIAAGNPTVTRTVTVLVNSDTLKEANETFFLNLSSPTNATIIDNQGVAIIVDEDRAYVSDFDRDLDADFSVFRPSESKWYVLQSTNATPKIVLFGTSADRPVPGDYDGDGLTDYAVYRDGTWFILRSTNGVTQIINWGLTGDKAVQGDYDGDGKTDVAIYRPSTGTWWVIKSSDSSTYSVPFGISTDRPVQGDYDGDAKTDIAVYRDGTWYILRSSDSSVQIQNWGLATDKPVSGDFDGDGKYDLAVYRDGDWWIISSLTGAAGSVHWGATGDIPVSADYDHDGRTDVAVFRPSSGDWFVLRSSNNSLVHIHWGLNGDIPVPAAYLPQ